MERRELGSFEFILHRLRVNRGVEHDGELKRGTVKRICCGFGEMARKV